MPVLLMFLASLGFSPIELRETTDPITDAKSFFAIIRDGDNSLSIGCSNVRDRATFRVKAQFSGYVGDASAGLLAGGREVAYRFDDRASTTVLWHSHDHYVFATPPENRPVLFATEMKGSSHLTMRTFNYAGEAQTFALDYRDPTGEIVSVLERCGFTAEGKKAKR